MLFTRKCYGHALWENHGPYQWVTETDGVPWYIDMSTYMNIHSTLGKKNIDTYYVQIQKSIYFTSCVAVDCGFVCPITT